MLTNDWPRNKWMLTTHFNKSIKRLKEIINIPVAL